MELIKSIFPDDENFMQKIDQIKEETIKKFRKGYKAGSNIDKSMQSSDGFNLTNRESSNKPSLFVTDKTKSMNGVNASKLDNNSTVNNLGTTHEDTNFNRTTNFKTEDKIPLKEKPIKKSNNDEGLIYKKESDSNRNDGKFPFYKY